MTTFQKPLLFNEGGRGADTCKSTKMPRSIFFTFTVLSHMYYICEKVKKDQHKMQIILKCIFIQHLLWFLNVPRFYFILSCSLSFYADFLLNEHSLSLPLNISVMY
jgi:hypothetical protein